MKKVFVFLFVLFLMEIFCFADYNQEDLYVARAYEDAKVVRVKFSSGETYVRRSYDEGLEEATPNLPVFEKDSVGTTDGRLELYLGRLNYVRLDYDTEITFERVPELRKTRTTLRINHGGMYLLVNSIDYRNDIQVRTPDCGIFILQKGKYRFNVNSQGGSELFVIQGMAQIHGQFEETGLGTMQQMTIFDGQIMTRPVSMMSLTMDDFGIWNRERNGMIDSYFGYQAQYLDKAYADYEYELSLAGNWRFDSTYNDYIWIPFHPGSDWKPYCNGRWIYHPYYGYVWTSYDRWGWFTHHYGRWHWSPAYGWYWIPGKRWSPAWVSWFYTDSYYGWCPLSRWNRPVVIINNRWIRNYRYGSGLPFNTSSLVVVKRVNLWTAKIHSIALNKQILYELRNQRLLFRGRTPTSKPLIRDISIVNAKGKTVKYKKSGFLTVKKYRIVNTTVDTEKVQYKYQGENGSVLKTKRINRYSSGKEKDKSKIRSMNKTGSKSTHPVYKPSTENKTKATKQDLAVKRVKTGQQQPIKKKSSFADPVVTQKRVVQKTTVIQTRKAPNTVVRKTTVTSSKGNNTKKKSKTSKKNSNKKKKRKKE